MDDGPAYTVNGSCGSPVKISAGSSEEISTETILPEGYTLEQNYPNPFNPETEIRFALPEAGQVTVKIFNATGQEVRTLVNGQYEAGVHSVSWNGRDNNGHAVASGVYLYQLQAGSFKQVRKMSLLR
jgi:WD40 repeat protein